MNTKNIVTVSLYLMSGLLLASCSSAKEKLGLNNKAPDEFQVLKHAPLALPPDYALRPPRPGAPRPQEQEMVKQAAQTVFGEAAENQPKRAPSKSAALLLRQAGANQADPSVRQTLGQETKDLAANNKTVVQKLIDIGGGEDEAPASLVDAAKEAERLKENAATGQAPTVGDTPIIIK